MHFLFLLKILVSSLISFSISSSPQTNELPNVKIVSHYATHPLVFNCTKTILQCIVTTSSSVSNLRVWWTLRGDNASKLMSTQISEISSNEWQLSIECATPQHSGVYTCHASLHNHTDQMDSKDAVVSVYAPISIKVIPDIGIIRDQIGSKQVILKCLVHAYPKASIKWGKIRAISESNKTEVNEIRPNEKIQVIYSELNEASQEGSLIINELSQTDNGTYVCMAENDYNQSEAILQLVVFEPPKVNIDRVEPITPQSVQLFWHVISNGNDNIERLILQLKNYSSVTTNDSDWIIIDDQIKPNDNGSYIIDNLTPAAAYGFQMSAINTAGQSDWTLMNVTMSPEAPAQITDIRVLASTNETLLVGWKRPHDNGAQITDYQMELKNIKESTIIEETMNIKNSSQKVRKNYMFIFVGLHPATQYSFHVRACSQLGCGIWSEPKLEAYTSDGHADAPKNVKLTCYFDTAKYTNYALISWNPTDNARGTVIGYNVTLYGVARYRNGNNQFVTDHFSEWHHVTNNSIYELSAVPLTANSNYTVRVCAINLGGCGAWSDNDTDDTRCSLPPAPPHTLPNFYFQQTDNIGQLKLNLPRVSERLGIITCYRVYLIKLPKGSRVIDLPKDISLLNVSSYAHVHYRDITHHPDVYLADEISSDNFTNEVVIGDGKFSKCKYDITNNQRDSSNKNPNVWVKRTTNTSIFSIESERVEDGPLQELTNYSGFIEIQVLGSNGVILRKQSSYMPAMQTSLPLMAMPNNTIAVSPLLSSISSPITTIILCLVSGFSLILLIVLLILLIRRGFGVTRRSVHTDEDDQFAVPQAKKVQSNHKVNGFLPSKILNNTTITQYMNPIHLTDMLQVYKERHVNNDRLFELEFSSLPLEFPDRTTHICDLDVNRDKNRFSSIKCYDLTRVQLSLIDQLQPNASDYINANFISINEKLYICTQGPLESTVSDFWRMIYEYECSVIVMLTSCEEHGRVKCTQYWPDEGCKTINSTYTVQLKTIRNFTDYTVRRFNLIANNKDTREILQLHFTQWPDFGTVELPSRILRFIKQVNENYCHDKGPLVIHCCAGIGRTGTYIAIDSLLPEISSGFVNIFERVSSLRHQRYHLVQNLKQYIFIYRALLDYILFGDTDVDIDHYRDYYHQLFENKNDIVNIPCEQFERLQLNFDEQKVCDYGSKPENVNKNRSNYIIPYDNNRVIIPVNNNEESNYINASLIQSYDQQLSFIVTQDPMEVTVNDFWSMIYENDVSQIAMLSQMDSTPRQCIKYWPSDELVFKNYSVKLMDENCSHNKSDYFLRRRFRIVKLSSVIETPHIVIQYQFISWHSNHIIPESAIPLIVLCEQMLSFHNMHTPIVIHCHDGAQRSGVCTSLISLLQQIKVDKRVDIFQTLRCMALQRRGMFQSIEQFVFLYRAIMNYIKHRNLCDTSDVVL